ncbi:AAA family ATPase [uncultured Mucilaginibacter sp.]|uniref:AAA family ATPase n=1 Tax=uncultured Mucilaginibacter sp. TaxID=797541 RepID=UPI0025F9C973|nr:AAA family ATPase [uncultured Mucilaginibacter sp.]
MQEHGSPPVKSFEDLQDKNKEIQPDFDFDKYGIRNESNIAAAEILDHANGIIKQAETETTGEQLLLSDIKEIPTLVYPFLQQTGLACLAGSSDTGKSSILRQLAVAVVTGENNFLGFQINAKHRSVIYVSTEDLERETAYLLSRQTQRYKPELLKGLRFVFDITNLYSKLDKRLTNKQADLVIIDCFADAYGGDLKDTQRIRTYLHTFQELAQKHECLILFLHHTGKRTENFEPNKNNLLSGQGFEAKMRLVIELRADLMNPLNRHLCIVKGNYLPASYKKESYVLQFDEQNFVFSNTGDRMPFELLVKQTDTDNSKAKYEQAKELKEQGLSYEQIAKKIGYNSKGSISKLFDKAKKNGWDNSLSDSVSTGNEGNE